MFISARGGQASKTLHWRSAKPLHAAPRLGVDVFKKLALYGVFCSLALPALIYSGQARQLPGAEPERIGLPWDWSHEHVVFSKATDPETLAKIQQDPRLFHQQLRQGLSSLGASADDTRSRNSLWARLQPSGTNSATLPPQTEGAGLRRLAEALNESFLSRVQAATWILGLSFATAFSMRRRGTTTVMTVLAIGVFLFLTSCGGIGTSTVKQTLGRDWGANIGQMSKITQTNANNAAPMYAAKYTFCKDFGK